MRLINSILLIAALCKLKVRAEDGIIGNLAFYGRGQRHLPNYWSENIKEYNGSKAYFPYNDSDEGNSSDASESKTNEITDKAKNYPLVLYLPTNSKLDFYVSNDDKSIDLTSFHKIKSEIKLVVPRVEDLIAEGYTCQSIGLNCEDLKNYDFKANVSEWLEKVNLEFLLESEEVVNDDTIDEEDQELYQVVIQGQANPYNEWSEYVGDIDETKNEISVTQYTYTDFIIQNSGTMPVYVFIGNTMFLKKNPTPMVINGTLQNKFSNWSWHRDATSMDISYFGDEVCPVDKEQKNCVKFVTKIDGAFAYYVHIESGISAPPEGVSFKIRPMNDNQFKFKIDNKKEFNLTADYLIHRNCKVPIGEETEFIIDVRSLVYSDPKFMLMNDISGFWLQTISEIDKIKERLREQYGDQVADDYEDVMYFYDFTLHHTFPEDTSMYVRSKLFEEGPDCNLELETHEDWGNKANVNKANPVIQWPDSISFDTIFKPKNTNTELNNPDLYTEGDNKTEEQNDQQKDQSSSAFNTVKPLMTLFLVSAILVLFF